MPRRPPAVARVLERVTETVRAHEMFLPGQTVLVSVSGGPDSMCLLYSLTHLRRLFRIRLAVFHFDHGLRSDSGSDAHYVKRQAAKLELPFHLRRAATGPERGESVEAWARTIRLTAANEVRNELEAVVAEGHTLDDQAETVLLALVRGGGLESVAGIYPKLGHRVQPLLDTRRSEVEAFCRALRLRPRSDPTNSDRRFLRNAIRLDVIPAFERATGRDVKGPIARSAALLSIDRLELMAEGARASDELVEERTGTVALPATALLTLRRAVAGRVIRLAVQRLGVMATEDMTTAILDLAAGRPGRKRNLPRGLLAVRDREYVRVSRPSPERRSAGPRGRTP